MSLRDWAIQTFSPEAANHIITAAELNKRLNFRVDAWVAANALCDKNGITNYGERALLISQLAKALEETYS